MQSIPKNAIHLWQIPLQQPLEALHLCAALLSPKEAAQAASFRLPHLRDRYTIAHAALRQILAQYLKTSPQALTFNHTKQGKPSLSPAINPAQITFNLSHSHDLALVAVARATRIGVDLELPEPKPDLLAIAARHFTPAENTAILALPEDQRTTAFYACWTLKEAYLKATGEGLSTSLNTFEVIFPPMAHAAVATADSRWRAWSFPLGNYTAALIAEGEEHTLTHAVWSSEMGQTR